MAGTESDSGRPPLQIKYEEFMRILAALKEAKWDYARIRFGDLDLTVSNGEVDVHDPGRPNAAARTIREVTDAVSPAPGRHALETPFPVADRAAQQLPSVEDDSAVVVKSPSIGTFWRSPQPGAPPFVEVGSIVDADQTICIVEVMKLLMHVTAPVSGQIETIHKQNGELVEYGETLFSIRSKAS